MKTCNAFTSKLSKILSRLRIMTEGSEVSWRPQPVIQLVLETLQPEPLHAR